MSACEQRWMGLLRFGLLRRLNIYLSRVTRSRGQRRRTALQGLSRQREAGWSAQELWSCGRVGALAGHPLNLLRDPAAVLRLFW